MTSRERPRGAFAVDDETLRLSVDLILLDLSDVVGDVVDELHAEAFRALREHPAKRLAHPVSDHLAVGPGEVRRCAHSAKVPLPFGRLEWHASQLAVDQFNSVFPRGSLSHPEVIRAHLMAQAARATVHKDHNLTDLIDTQRRRCPRIEDLVDDLYFKEVIAGSQRTNLAAPALLGCLTDSVRIGLREATVRFDHIQVAWPTIAFLHRPPRAALEHIIDLAHADLDATGRPDAGGNVDEQRIDERLNLRPYIGLHEICANETHAAVDVVADSARADDAVIDAERCNAADRESIPPMNIRHGKRIANNSRQRGNVGHLLQRLLLGNLAQHAFVGEDEPGHAHAGLVGRRNLPTIVVDLFQNVSPGNAHGLPGLPSLHGLDK